MNKTPIDNAPAGPAMDAAVAERVSFSSDQLLDAMIKSAKSEREFIIMAVKNLYDFQANPEATYQAYADALGKPPVTDEEKKQAYLDYILSENDNIT